MAIDVRELQTRPLDPIIADELDIFERTLQEYLDGRVRPLYILDRLTKDSWRWEAK